MHEEPSPAAVERLASGRALYAQGRFDEAQAELEAACRLAPDSVEALATFGLLLLDSDEPGEARRVLERAVDLGARTPEVLRAMAEACCRTGAYGEAAEYYDRAAEVAPQDPTAIQHRLNGALCRYRIGAADESERALETLHGEQPDDATVALALAQVLAHRPGGRHRATELLEDLLEREPQHVLARYDLGLLLARSKAEDPSLRGPAIAHLEELIRSPGYPEQVPDAHLAHFALAACYDDEPSGYELAATHYREALVLRPSFAPALCNLGIIQERLGLRSQALALFARALRADPRCEAAASHLAGLCMEAEDSDAVHGLCEALDLPMNRAQAARTVLRAVEDRAQADGQVALCEAVHRVKNRAGVLAARLKSQPTVECADADSEVPGLPELAGMIYDDLNALLAVLRPVEADAEVVDANVVVRRAAAMVRAWAPSGIDVTCDLSQTSLPIRVDRERIRDLLAHLARNAVTAMPNGGQLSFACRTGTQGLGWVAIQVGDTGVGIPSESLDEVTLPGVSLRPGGSGLGLWICARIARAHGGSLRLESQEGHGSVATLELPPPEYPSLAARTLRVRRPLMTLAMPEALELTDEHTPTRLNEGAS